MAFALVSARLALALVFLAAGAAKLRDLDGARRAVGEFGVPGLLVKPLGTALPFVELGAAAALIVTASARVGSVVALALLLAFSAAIALALIRGHEPDCHCFGQLHSAPAGAGTLLRNLGLASVAAFAVGAGWSHAGDSATAWIGRLDATQAVALAGGVLMFAALVFLGWFSLQLLRQNGRLLARIETIEGRLGMTQSSAVAPQNGHHIAGLPVGSPAPGFSLPDRSGQIQTLEALLARGRPVALIFSDTGCGPCNALLPDVAAWQRELRGRVTIALLSRGEENEKVAQTHADIDDVLLQGERDVAEQYRVYGTPSAVLIDTSGRVASSAAGGADAIRDLIERSAEAGPRLEIVHAGSGRRNENPAAVAIGDPVPNLALPDLEGQLRRLSDLGRGDKLLLFWNPNCGFCQQMLPKLREWEAEKRAGAPRIVLVSEGGNGANPAEGLSSLILLDEDGRAMEAFHAHGTPMAVRINAAGYVASQVAAGAGAIFALAAADNASGEGARADESLV